MTLPAPASNSTPVLVILPGLDGGTGLVRPFVDHLSAVVASVVLALPADAPLDERLIEGVGDRLPRDGSFFLLGQSVTTPLAIELARRQRVRGLVLVAPPGLRRPRFGLAAALRFTPRLLLRPRPPRFAVRWLLLGRDAPPDLLSAFEAAVRAVPARVLAGRIRTFGRLTTTALPAAPCPTLFLHARQDCLLTGAYPVASGDRVRHVTLDGPHLLLARRPGESAAEVAAFLASVPA